MKRLLSPIYRFLWLCILAIFQTLTLVAQSDPSVEMADTMRREGKIYVVVALLASVFVGIVIYLLILERRVKKIEREFHK